MPRKSVSIRQHVTSHHFPLLVGKGAKGEQEAARLSKILAIRQHTCSQRGSKSQGNSMKSSLFSASKPRWLELGHMLGAVLSLVLNCPQGTQGGDLGLGQSSYARD